MAKERNTEWKSTLIYKKIKQENYITKLTYPKFVEVCLDFVSYVVLPSSEKEIFHTDLQYARDFLRGKINNVARFEQEKKAYQNLSQLHGLDKEIQCLTKFCLTYNFLTIEYLETSEKSKSKLGFKRVVHSVFNSPLIFLQCLEEIDAKYCDQFYEYLQECI
ncbi:hypothetical protein [Capnocytophaga felis]|uniref:Uncharacterized protein n=1 Tax=Capnocytophaga felis TaxID=2267611 RepID=A0A5M4B6Z3_9FLAO|nr:hypothetical protein [Capnocytophaga felis]GET45359.1 hypothetical protein RCZ01_06610 [Capnocytophaga felis]GET47478.1 hypothetical protein RCZ02_03090 [Capnocytophaga felis]